jgi:two-component SAPR family response regulator
MLSVILIDDEQPTLEWLNRLIQKHTDLIVAGMYTKVSEALAEAERVKPDAAFVDIEMPGLSGLKAAAKLHEIREDMEIIFVTAHSEYAIQAFQANAIDYLLKPVSPKEVVRCANKLKKRKKVSHVPQSEQQEPKLVCFGGFRVDLPGSQEPIRFPTAKVEELFAFLLLNRQAAVSKWKICETLWPEYEPEKAEQNLHTTVYRLRKLFNERRLPCQLLLQFGGYRLEWQGSCDLAEFAEKGEIALKEPVRANLESAIASYGGPLFAEKDYAWCLSERELLERRYAYLAKRLAECYRNEGDPLLALELISSRVEKAIQYCDEELYEIKLEILMETGDRTSFFYHYNKLKERLQQDLGVEPGPKIHSLYEQMTR